MGIIAAILITTVIVGGISYIVFGTLLKAALKEQREELSKDCHQKFAKLTYEYSHNGEIPLTSRVVGLSRITSLALQKDIEDLEELYEKQDYRTRHIILRLYRLRGEELKFLENAMQEWLVSRREILREYDDDGRL